MGGGGGAALPGSCAHGRLPPLLAMAIHTGLRRGELLGLRWKYIDFAASTLRVVQTIPATADQ